jgi:hypothetical protein
MTPILDAFFLGQFTIKLILPMGLNEQAPTNAPVVNEIVLAVLG